MTPAEKKARNEALEEAAFYCEISANTVVKIPSADRSDDNGQVKMAEYLAEVIRTLKDET